MRSLPLTFLAVAMLLTPATALAGTPSSATATATATARFFEIRALAFGDAKLEAVGKIAFQGDQLTASAGCNMIGGRVRVDGATMKIVGLTLTTEMACRGSDGVDEAMLIKILGLGTFTITDSGWVADGGQIVTVEIVAKGPGPGSPPNEPISSTPAVTIVEPVPINPPDATCPPVPIDSKTTPVDSGPPFGGTGGGATGSGSSAGSGTATGPGVVVPGATPVTGTGGVEPPPPAPVPGGTPSLGQVVPEPSLGVVPPGPIGNDPNVGKPVDPCYRAAFGANPPVPEVAAKASDAVDGHATGDPADRTALIVPLVGALGILLALGAGIYRRRHATSR